MAGQQMKNRKLFTAAVAALLAVGAAVGSDVRRPGAFHRADIRAHVGIPSVAVSPVNGRMWATWYNGKSRGEDLYNYVTLVTSADGGKHWKEVLVADPDEDGPKRSFDPGLWISPDGKLRWTWTERMCDPSKGDPTKDYGLDSGDEKTDVVWMATLSAEDEPQLPVETRAVGRGVMMCKPIALRNGEWLLPLAHWYAEPSACFYVSRDGGRTFEYRGGATLPKDCRRYDEHQAVERANGDVVVFIRSDWDHDGKTFHPWMSVSKDRGRTWEDPVRASYHHTSSRVFVSRLRSGNWLLVKNGPIDRNVGRRELTACLSKDEGRTWVGGLVLDERVNVTYPDGQQLSDGSIVVIYDRNRLTDKEILFARFSEDDVLAGKNVSGNLLLKAVITSRNVLRSAQSASSGERYAYVRAFKVDGREVRLDEGETELDLAKIYPDDWKPGVGGTRWAAVETTVESDADKTVRFYYGNDWYGELSVNGTLVKGDMGGPVEALASLDIPVRKGTNTITLRTRAGTGSWRCSFAFDGEKRPGAADGEVDFTKTAGRIRPLLHSSGFGPQICSCPKSAIDEVRSMNFAAARTHDWALINPNERVCDYFHVFPLMKLDAKDPSNYHFGPTDYLLKRTREETGLDVFYRLGTSIEHSGEKVHFNALIPEDFGKVAEIFAGTIRHYNRGWANGFDWGIRYWEIWNEPDGHNNMWCLPDGDGASGSEKDARRRELFVRFFVTCLKRLKSEFPEVKVGGPALCDMNGAYFRALLEGCRSAGVAPDFLSWHYYGSSVEAILGSVERCRKLCDDMGFGACELVLNEWHYLGCGWNELRSADPVVQERVWSGPASHNGTDSAAFTLSVLARFQASALDQGYYYGCRPTGAWGYKDERKRLYKVYYALKAFGEIVRDYPELGEVKTAGSLTTLVARSADGRRTALLAVDYRGLPGDIVLGTRGLPGGRPSARVLDHTRDLAPADVRVEGGRLVLPKRDRDSVSYLVTWER